MDQPIEQGIGDGGVFNQFVPGAERILAGDQGGAGTLTVVEQFEEEAVVIGL